jgi:hypothetical protein
VPVAGHFAARAPLVSAVMTKLWEMADMVKVLEDWEAEQA